MARDGGPRGGAFLSAACTCCHRAAVDEADVEAEEADDDDDDDDDGDD